MRHEWKLVITIVMALKGRITGSLIVDVLTWIPTKHISWTESLLVFVFSLVHIFFIPAVEWSYNEEIDVFISLNRLVPAQLFDSIGLPSINEIQWFTRFMCFIQNFLIYRVCRYVLRAPTSVCIASTASFALNSAVVMAPTSPDCLMQWPLTLILLGLNWVPFLTFLGPVLQFILTFVYIAYRMTNYTGILTTAAIGLGACYFAHPRVNYSGRKISVGLLVPISLSILAASCRNIYESILIEKNSIVTTTAGFDLFITIASACNLFFAFSNVNIYRAIAAPAVSFIVMASSTLDIFRREHILSQLLPDRVSSSNFILAHEALFFSLLSATFLSFFAAYIRVTYFVERAKAAAAQIANPANRPCIDAEELDRLIDNGQCDEEDSPDILDDPRDPVAPVSEKQKKSQAAVEAAKISSSGVKTMNSLESTHLKEEEKKSELRQRKKPSQQLEDKDKKSSTTAPVSTSRKGNHATQSKNDKQNNAETEDEEEPKLVEVPTLPLSHPVHRQRHVVSVWSLLRAKHSVPAPKLRFVFALAVITLGIRSLLNFGSLMNELSVIFSPRLVRITQQVELASSSSFDEFSHLDKAIKVASMLHHSNSASTIIGGSYTPPEEASNMLHFLSQSLRSSDIIQHRPLVEELTIRSLVDANLNLEALSLASDLALSSKSSTSPLIFRALATAAVRTKKFSTAIAYAQHCAVPEAANPDLIVNPSIYKLHPSIPESETLFKSRNELVSSSSSVGLASIPYAPYVSDCILLKLLSRASMSPEINPAARANHNFHMEEIEPFEESDFENTKKNLFSQLAVASMQSTYLESAIQGSNFLSRQIAGSLIAAIMSRLDHPDFAPGDVEMSYKEFTTTLPSALPGELGASHVAQVAMKDASKALGDLEKLVNNLKALFELSKALNPSKSQEETEEFKYMTNLVNSDIFDSIPIRYSSQFTLKRIPLNDAEITEVLDNFPLPSQLGDGKEFEYINSFKRHHSERILSDLEVDLEEIGTALLEQMSGRRKIDSRKKQQQNNVLISSYIDASLYYAEYHPEAIYPSIF